MSKYIAQWRDGFRVSWRNLTKTEYQQFRSRFEQSPFAEPIDVAMDIYETVLIEGPDPRYVPAGIPAYICKQQMIDNPFSGDYEDIATALELARRVVTGNYLLAATAIISSTLHYKPEEIEQWDVNKFFVRLAQAEIANGRTFDPVDPNAVKDAKGQKVDPKKIKRPLSPSQVKAIERAKERDRGA